MLAVAGLAFRLIAESAELWSKIARAYSESPFEHQRKRQRIDRRAVVDSTVIARSVTQVHGRIELEDLLVRHCGHKPGTVALLPVPPCAAADVLVEATFVVAPDNMVGIDA